MACLNQGRSGRPFSSRNARSTCASRSFSLASVRAVHSVAFRDHRGGSVELLRLDLKRANGLDQTRKPGELGLDIRLRGVGLAYLLGMDQAELVDVFAQGHAVGDELERHDVGGRGSHRDQGVEPGRRGMRQELGVAEFLHPVEVVVDRVIDAISPMEADVEGRHSQMVEKRREVGPGAERAQLWEEAPGAGPCESRLHPR